MDGEIDGGFSDAFCSVLLFFSFAAIDIFL